MKLIDKQWLIWASGMYINLYTSQDFSKYNVWRLKDQELSDAEIDNWIKILQEHKHWKPWTKDNCPSLKEFLSDLEKSEGYKRFYRQCPMENNKPQ